MLRKISALILVGVMVIPLVFCSSHMKAYGVENGDSMKAGVTSLSNEEGPAAGPPENEGGEPGEPGEPEGGDPGDGENEPGEPGEPGEPSGPEEPGEPVDSGGTEGPGGSGDPEGQTGEDTETDGVKEVAEEPQKETEAYSGIPLHVYAGDQYSLVQNEDGGVWAWGYGGFGQLGNGGFEDSALPVRVEGLSDIRTVFAGDRRSLAVVDGGTVFGWGDARPAGNSESPEGQVRGSSASRIPVLDDIGSVWAYGDGNLAVTAD
ncbi:MAG: hypothetical protein FWG03_07130, partial [Clostridiales bacterium]|nr:hypothetical protein [Clostridiales bacterium]